MVPTLKIHFQEKKNRIRNTETDNLDVWRGKDRWPVKTDEQKDRQTTGWMGELKP